jgi:hypothetical protein
VTRRTECSLLVEGVAGYARPVPANARATLAAVVTAVLVACLLAGCASAGSASPTTTGGRGSEASTSTSSTAATTTTLLPPVSPVDPAAIPLGDGHVTSSPKVGDVDSCVTSFNGQGAETAGAWLDTAAGTWDSAEKPAVEGAVSWPSARYSVTVSGSSRVITGNDLPIDHTTGVFPISPSDPAYQYDHNPNSIQPQTVDWTLPLDPAPAATPQCLGLGPIGILDDGVLLFDALDAEGRDAGAHEILDSCGEHPQANGILHHHYVPPCILEKATGPATLVGYAADGYGIYVERDANGELLTNADLDACHGRTSMVPWNGKEQMVYHYDATLEYPYTLGCYHGRPIDTQDRGGP